jgi:hypothetical protein
MDRLAAFFGGERPANFSVNAGTVVNQGSFSMDFASPLMSRLSVVAAYVALAFVGAIVLGVI